MSADEQCLRCEFRTPIDVGGPGCGVVARGLDHGPATPLSNLLQAAALDFDLRGLEQGLVAFSNRQAFRQRGNCVETSVFSGDSKLVPFPGTVVYGADRA